MYPFVVVVSFVLFVVFGFVELFVVVLPPKHETHLEVDSLQVYVYALLE